MWEAFSNILTSDNAAMVLVVAIGIILLIGFATKKGLLSLDINGVKLGHSEEERSILRAQTEYAYNSIMAFERTLKKPNDYIEYKGRYVFLSVYKEVVSWILFNHIEVKSSYIEVKYDTALHIILNKSDNSYLRSDEFQETLHEYIGSLIRKLVEIRRNYK